MVFYFHMCTCSFEKRNVHVNLNLTSLLFSAGVSSIGLNIEYHNNFNEVTYLQLKSSLISPNLLPFTREIKFVIGIYSHHLQQGI